MSENVVIKKDRTVTVPASEVKIGVQYDHNVNVITFDCPRYPDDDQNVDMSTMQIYINYMLPDKTLGSYLAENVKVDTNNPDTIHFDWKITRNVTQVKGALQALVCIKKVDAEGNELYHWNTDLIQSFRVGEGMECLETISSDYADVISQLLVNMNTVTGEFEALSADVTARTSEETLQGLVNNVASDEKLESIVNTYMEANPVGINVDDSLAVSGDAADAKITGDRISELKGDIDDLESEIFDPTSGILQNNVRLNKLAKTETVLNLFNKATSVDGYKLSASGKPVANDSYTVSDYILLPSKSKVYLYYFDFDNTTVKPNTNVYICFYTYNKEMIGTIITSTSVTDVPIGAKYIRIAPSIKNKDSCMLFVNDESCAPSEYVKYMDGVNNKFAFEDKIAEMEETLSVSTPIEKEVADNLNLASFEKGTAISKNATYNTYYIHTNGNLSSLGEQFTNYNVFEYRLEANKKYVLSGRVALNGDLPLFGVKDTSGTSGKVTILKSIGKNYEDVYIEYTAEKDEYLFVAAYSSRGELIVYNAIVSYDYNDVVRVRSIQSITNPWYGKKVVWLGTSVPAGQYADTSYAYEVAKYLGINLVNTSIPGLSIHLNENGEPRLSPYAGSSSATIAEYEAVGVTIPTSKTASGYYKSYEHIFEEENADADSYAFDVAPNNGNFDMSDWDAFNKNTWAYNDGTPFSEHRKTFLGALLFLMDKMYTLNPKARMVFVLGSSFAYTNGKEAFETVSAQWNIPIINVWEKINTSPKSLPIIKSKDGTDNHPSTYAHQCMGKMLIGEFLKIG